MEFEYYTDDIILNKKAMNNEVTLLAFDRFIDASKAHLREAGIDFQNVGFFYKRNKKRESVLGVQLHDGDIEDLSNYLVYDCKHHTEGKKVFCSIDMHSDKKAADKAMPFASLASDDVVDFFISVEELIHKSGQPDLEFDNMEQIVLSKKKPQPFTKLLDRFRKNKTRAI